LKDSDEARASFQHGGYWLIVRRERKADTACANTAVSLRFRQRFSIVTGRYF
jgi:hypothetical protein